MTRPDEPGGEPGSPRDGGVLRLLARDTVVAQRIAADVRGAGRRALVLAGDHEYGVQLDGQLTLAGLPRADGRSDADLVVLCGLAGAPEVEAAVTSRRCRSSRSTACRAPTSASIPTSASSCRSRPSRASPTATSSAARTTHGERRS